MINMPCTVYNLKWIPTTYKTLPDGTKQFDQKGRHVPGDVLCTGMLLDLVGVGGEDGGVVAVVMKDDGFLLEACVSQVQMGVAS